MGWVRLLLALCVLDFHSVHAGNASLWPTYLPNGLVAVRAFYVISGFYMALVLSGRYANEPVWMFYRARLLRLLPMYWIVALASIAFCIVARWPIVAEFAKVAIERPLLAAWVFFSNVTMIGQDWAFLITIRDGQMLSRYNLVDVAWTLGIELTFYAIAPALILLRTRWLMTLLLCSIALKLVGARYGYVGDPWGERLFPLELAWFLLGMIAYRTYVFGMAIDPVAMKRAGVVALALIVLSIGWYSGLYFNRVFGRIFPGAGSALPLVTALVLPFVFALTKDSKVDSFVGEFSYPVYLVHSLVLMTLLRAAPAYNSGAAVLVISLLIAAVLLFVLRPIERHRQPRAAIA